MKKTIQPTGGKQRGSLELLTQEGEAEGSLPARCQGLVRVSELVGYVTIMNASQRPAIFGSSRLAVFIV
jgi:hypothetical protein